MDSLSSFHVLTDFGILSIIIVMAHLLRNRVKLLQNTYVPSSIIAGIICLFLGRQFFDIIPFSINSDGVQNIGSYPSFLVVLLFATIFLGKKKKTASVKKVLEHAGDTFFFNLASITGQYGFALLFGLLFLEPVFKELPHGFAIFLPAGFAGGHGTAAAISGVLESNGFEGALSIGYASATIGLLIGVLGGMIIINIGTRLGWSRIVQSVQEMPQSMKSGFVPEEEQQPMGLETVHPIALDPLTWHIAIVIGTATLAYAAAAAINKFFGVSVPVFCVALVMGALIQKIFNLTKFGRYVDRHVVQRVGSLVTDFLIGFGIASISIDIVFNFALPLVILFAFGTVFTISFLWLIGPRICRNFWFERTIAVFGWNFGTVATSIMLLKVIDPDMRSMVMEDFSVSYFGIAFAEIAIVSLLPQFIINGYVLGPSLFLVASFFGCLILSRVLVGWHHRDVVSISQVELIIICVAEADE